tara:strand:- start:58067 stop:58909 length:843 start_codon:yes stop_codon:yes gene_type:complete
VDIYATANYEDLTTRNLDILNNFIAAPDLILTRKKYPFTSFNFKEETIAESEFNFPKNAVLGMQAEACFKAFLNSSKNYSLLAANLQINTEKETLGELDYIVQDCKTQEVIHIELACKFYLFDKNNGACDEKKWIGPNRKDTLFDKLEKVKFKQFPLLNKAATIEKLKSLKIEIPTTQQLCIKAFFFIPKEINSDQFPKNIAECIMGHFINYDEFRNEVATAVYAMPTKKEWLLPIANILNWYSFSEISEKVALQIRNNKSPLIYKKTPNKVERLFVVWW